MNAGFEGQNYRKLEKVKCSPSAKMKSNSFVEAKAECYQNSRCYMMYPQNNEKEFHFCSVENGRLLYDDNHVTYVKGKHLSLFVTLVN